MGIVVLRTFLLKHFTDIPRATQRNEGDFEGVNGDKRVFFEKYWQTNKWTGHILKGEVRRRQVYQKKPEPEKWIQCILKSMGLSAKISKYQPNSIQFKTMFISQPPGKYHFLFFE